MSQRTATITSLPMAFEVVKAMQADGLDWGDGYRPLGRQALEEIIEGQMAAAVDCYLDQLEADDAADRRNGYYRRRLLAKLGDIELHVPRTRRYSPTEVIRAYARRTREIDRVILALRARPVDAQGGRDGACLAWAFGEPQHSEPGCQDARCCGGGLPSTAAAEPLQSADARRRRALPQDRCRRPAQAGSRCLGAAPRRQEGDHRLPLGGERKRRRMGEIPRRSLPPWARRRGSRHDLRRWRRRPACCLTRHLPRHPGSALLGAQDQEHPGQGQKGRSASRQARSA